jgi:hypothetical protein
MQRRTFLLSSAAVLLLPLSAVAEANFRATLYKNPQCQCCEGYADYLRKNGFTVEVKPTNDLAEISRKAGVPGNLEGCHTMFVEGYPYVIDGHVPIEVVRKLLSEKPAIAGITLPGMPTGSPGMFGDKTEKFVIYAFGKGGANPTVYATI